MLAPGPDVVLMDEPFSGLDASLRDEVRGTTLSRLKQAEAAVVMVTHDPDEAMRVGMCRCHGSGPYRPDRSDRNLPRPRLPGRRPVRGRQYVSLVINGCALTFSIPRFPGRRDRAEIVFRPSAVHVTGGFRPGFAVRQRRPAEVEAAIHLSSCLRCGCPFLRAAALEAGIAPGRGYPPVGPAEDVRFPAAIRPADEDRAPAGKESGCSEANWDRDLGALKMGCAMMSLMSK
jgi:hypothetical protein